MSSPHAAAAPAQHRDAGRWATALELGLLGAVWGASFLFMRIAADDFGPAPLVELRLALGSLVLLPFLWRARAQFPARLWPKLALIGAMAILVGGVLRLAGRSLQVVRDDPERR